MEKLRALPFWLRLFLALLPVFMCLPLACIVLFGYQQVADWQAATVTYAFEQTRNAAAATGQAVNAAGTVAAQETAAAVGAVQTANAEATLLAQTEAALLEAFSLTQTALVPTASDFSPTAAPSETPTKKPAVASTPLPKTVTVTIRECRNWEGTVLFGQAQPQSLHAQGTLSFTVPPGTYKLRILWLNHRDQDTDMNLNLTKSQTIQFGDQCQ